MRNIVLAVVFTATALAALCARAADDDIIAVEYKDLPKVWKREGGSNEAWPVSSRTYRVGCANLSFVVESSGDVSTTKVRSAFPDTEFGELARKVVGYWRFEPTALNKNRIPAYTEYTMVWISPQYEQVLGSHLPAKLDREGVAAQCKLAASRDPRS